MGDEVEDKGVKTGHLSFNRNGQLVLDMYELSTLFSRADVRNLINMLEREESGDVHSRA